MRTDSRFGSSVCSACLARASAATAPNRWTCPRPRARPHRRRSRCTVAVYVDRNLAASAELQTALGPSPKDHSGWQSLGPVDVVVADRDVTTVLESETRRRSRRAGLAALASRPPGSTRLQRFETALFGTAARPPTIVPGVTATPGSRVRSRSSRRARTSRQFERSQVLTDGPRRGVRGGCGVAAIDDACRRLGSGKPDDRTEVAAGRWRRFRRGPGGILSAVRRAHGNPQHRQRARGVQALPPGRSGASRPGATWRRQVGSSFRWRPKTWAPPPPGPSSAAVIVFSSFSAWRKMPFGPRTTRISCSIRSAPNDTWQRQAAETSPWAPTVSMI